MTVTINYSGKVGIGLRSGHLHMEGLRPSLSQHVRGLTCHLSPAKPTALLFYPRLVPSWLPVTLSCSHSSAIPLPHSQLKSQGLKADQWLPTINGMVHITTCRSPLTGDQPNCSASPPSPHLHRSLTQSPDSPTRQWVPCTPLPCMCRSLEQDTCLVITYLSAATQALPGEDAHLPLLGPKRCSAHKAHPDSSVAAYALSMLMPWTDALSGQSVH